MPTTVVVPPRLKVPNQCEGRSRQQRALFGEVGANLREIISNLRHDWLGVWRAFTASIKVRCFRATSHLLSPNLVADCDRWYVEGLCLKMEGTEIPN